MLFFRYGADYRRTVLWQRLLKGDSANAYETAIGGSFAAIGARQLDVLREHGLRDDSSIIDVGCGAGRLAAQLAPLPGISYLGTDVVPELLQHARAAVNRPDWRFEMIDRTRIPAPDGMADMCVFFSVFTHLTEDICLTYLAEAKRVLKPGGAVVFSFLDPGLPAHARSLSTGLLHRLARRTVYARNEGHAPERLHGWAQQSGFEVRIIASPHPLGQSLAVFGKPATPG